MKNYGLKFDTPSSEHYVFGGLGGVPKEILQLDKDWRSFLPQKEYQNLNNIEPFACVSFTILNAIEILIRRKYGIERNYSDRFLAVVSGTKAGGNSPQAVAEALRDRGVPLQETWPFDQNINTFEEFYKEIPTGIIELAKEFNNEWEFKHDFVAPNHEAISEALKCSPLLISVSAWFEQDGRYYRPEGMTDNHATTLIYEQEGEYMEVFDSYADNKDDPALKEVEWNAVPIVVKRFWIEKRKIKKSFWQIIKEFLGL